MAKKRKQEPEPSDYDEGEVDNNIEEEEETMNEALSSEDEDEDHSAPDPIPTPVVVSNQSSMTSDGRYHNKQRLLVLSSRGITARYRHLLEDLRTLIPHSKKESKLDVGK